MNFEKPYYQSTINFKSLVDARTRYLKSDKLLTHLPSHVPIPAFAINYEPGSKHLLVPLQKSFQMLRDGNRSSV